MINQLSHVETSPSASDILNLLPVAVYTCNKEGNITYFNETAVKLWGYRPDLGNPLLKFCARYKVFVNGTYVPPEQTPMAVTLESGQPFRDIQALVERPDGTTFHALVSIDPLFDNEHRLTGAINVFRDITGIKKEEMDLKESEERHRQLTELLEKKVEDRVNDLRVATEKLKKSEEQYHKMIEEVEDYAIILLDKNGIVRNWNKGAEKIKGYKEKEIIGKSFEEFYLPEDQQNGLPLKLLSEAGEQGKAIYEGWRKRNDGSIFWGSVVLTALHNDQGEVIGFSKVTRDLTAKKKAEDRMNEYLEQLEFQNKELEQFVYAASHDMKEPLRKIHIYNSYILSNASNVLDEKSKEYFSRSIQATQRMNNLIEDLLAYARLTNISESYELVDLNDVVDEIFAFHKEDFEQRRITLERNTLPVIKAIPFQIKQLFSNLIDNSAKYKHPEREGHISIASEKVNGRSVKIADPFREYHKITVTDNGIGFDPSFAAKIFELFQRLPTTMGTKGTGIGLAICKKIVQNHNGWIEASGKTGEGAVFSIYLPAV